ncbi:hypothetical protein FO519_004036 [Halicephalobus sp. NKZ332]|nr:hypothetical protein FO519_004036 [Halicephalobus sp. NKZ332]
MAHNAGSNKGVNDDDSMEVADEHLHEKPIEALKMQPKKSILKNRGNSIEDKHGEKTDDTKAHFDEMNILATYHPADKDYGHMKIDEPKTPYHMSDTEDDASTSSQSKRRVSLVGLETQVKEGLENPRDKSQSVVSNDDDSDDESEESARRRREFYEKRKKHYVKEGAPIKAKLPDDEDDDLPTTNSSTAK